MKSESVVGRFAPSPSGRMHLGNIATALVSWLSVRKQGGRWILRIEDLDPDRSKYEYARLIEDDLDWLGLNFDEGGMDNYGDKGPYSQSQRSEYYAAAFNRLCELGVLYPCYCTRADILASRAPHVSDGRVVYGGKCRPSVIPTTDKRDLHKEHAAIRLYVPNRYIAFTDGIFGTQHINLAEECGDFVVRRADGAWAYQLAAAVDDALMGITEVVRGNDLLSSTPQQLYIMDLLGIRPPRYIHIPLLCNAEGKRLSKRDSSASMEELRKRYTPHELTGIVAHLLGLRTDATPISPLDLAEEFSFDNILRSECIKIV